MHPITGLHHMTFMASSPQANLDFYTKTLGLRLVKKTVNFDAPDVYHLYFADALGTPGTVLTSFPFPNMRRGRRGSAQMTVTRLGVPQGSLGFWKKRLDQHRVHVEETQSLDGSDTLRFEDPDGLGLELIETHQSAAHPALGPGMEARTAIAGIHTALLQVEAPSRTARLLIEVMDYEEIEHGQHFIRLAPKAGSEMGLVELHHRPGLPQGRQGAGIVHHLAFATPSDETQLDLQRRLIDFGLHPTEVKDRQYFRSIYFREPNGVLFEIATVPPGFTLDEAPGELGAHLKLPPWQEGQRASLEAQLPLLSTGENAEP